MLHATAHHGKSTLYKRYLGHRDKTEKCVHEEDEITSTILGPLDFLAPADVHYFWSSVFEQINLDFPLGCVTAAKVSFWDSRPADDGRSIEPDARVDLCSDEASLILLIELKWRAPLRPKDQLHRQWGKYLTKIEQQNAIHIFIAPETSAGIAARQENDVWGDRLILITWGQIRTVLKKLGEDASSGLGRWAGVSDKFLERIGIHRFSGFCHLAESASYPIKNSRPIFWNPFRGFCDMEAGLNLTEGVPKTLFFTLTKEIK